ncbi:TPA: restriction endonuclease subunit S [Vibrio parahaemolyticus]|uniref:Restriction endonuclease subunit S n=1 Tax=Vibrio parahaemolyticus TaxID=670 RepID=A0A7Y0X403_VIBPH|nr:restriction endonuclease subunit S [Vibrio parahaemolyticus]EHC7290535.1 restriction endonuclease subunit S [Vibrio parahaemolyticus]EID7757867.1 restriction endonuclease subunit S [Vibrio parahaemolyticus]EJE4149463.1 restriction endonuclease subunit S [Vibrio parahaemolyticus]MDF5241793.1 restriction endonuclease subunit S [Vibrio parahaemolyticus]MDF5495101.1 restriction endonuclease subunit S [Vibrio parahaemolyticus]
MKPYPRYNQSSARWYSSFPETWSEVKAKRLFSNERERASSEDEQLAASQKYGVIPQALMMAQNNAKVMLALKGTDNFKQVKENDFVISLRSFEGGIEHSKYNGCISPAYTVLRLRHESSNPNYFRYALKCSPFIQALNSTSEGIRDGKTITYDEFGELLVALPNQAEQKAIATFLDRETQRIDSLIEEKQTFIKLLKEKRQALISHVVTKGLNPNVEMQDSGIEWIGQVPKHWEVKKIKHICSNFMYGTSQDCNQSDVGYPVLRIPNIKSTNVDFEDLKYANISDVDALTYLLSRGDILVIRTNGNPNLVGQSALFDSNGQYLFASYLIKLTPKRGVDTSFLVEAMNSLSVRQALTFQSRTSVGNYNLSIPSLANTSIAIPPIDEQKTITNYLSAATINIDLLIQETDKSIDLLKEHRTSLISAAVTGKIDVREAV